MKTISGKSISSKPVSLSKAAKILSGFAGHENGASDAVSVYLKRAADAFNSLVSCHKELKNPHSHRKHRTPNVKIEENSGAGKVEIRERKGKSKKNAFFEVNTKEALEVEKPRVSLVFQGKNEKILINKRKGERYFNKEIKIKQISAEVGEENVKIQESMDIEQATSHQVGEKKKKKKDKKEKIRNEDPIKIERSPHGEPVDREMQLLDEGGKGNESKGESTGMEQHADEIDEASMKKREKKKRKKRDGEEAGESVELEERKSRDIDGGVTIDLAEPSGKKKGKRRKTKRKD